MTEELSAGQIALMDELLKLGFPAEFAYAIALQAKGEWTERSLFSYLKGAKPHTMEDVADELVALLERREHFKQKHLAERANASYTQFLNRPRD